MSANDTTTTDLGPCEVCGAPATDEVCDINRMPVGVQVWVAVCDAHQDAADPGPEVDTDDAETPAEAPSTRHHVEWFDARSSRVMSCTYPTRDLAVSGAARAVEDHGSATVYDALWRPVWADGKAL